MALKESETALSQKAGAGTDHSPTHRQAASDKRSPAASCQA